LGVNSLGTKAISRTTSNKSELRRQNEEIKKVLGEKQLVIKKQGSFNKIEPKLEDRLGIASKCMKAEYCVKTVLNLVKIVRSIEIIHIDGGKMTGKQKGTIKCGQKEMTVLHITGRHYTLSITQMVS